MTTLALRRPTLLEIDPWWVADVGFARMRVTSPFGERGGGFHGGLDIGNARLGDVLLATAPGRVIAAGLIGRPWTTAKPSDAWWYSQPASADGKRGGLFGPPSRWTGTTYGGRMVVIEHAPGVVSIWAHMATVDVAVGDRVVAWERIGTVGDSGSAYRQGHTHFGIQAPATAVPAGVKTHATGLGFGLDVDPWPLITGQAVLTLQEDDVKIPSGLRPIAQGVVGPLNRLRADAATKDGSRIIGGDGDDAIGEAKDYFVQVYGFGVEGEPYTLGGKAGSTYAWVGVFGETWFIAEPLVTDLALTATGMQQLPAIDDCSDEIAKAAAADGRTEALRQDAIEHLEGLRTTNGAAIDRAIADLRAP